MITINANIGISRQKNNKVTFEKSPKQIIAEAPNKELQKILKEVTADRDAEIVLEMGIPKLLKYALKGELEKKQVIQSLKDVAESKELQSSPTKFNLFNGYRGFEDEYPGYLKAYEKLTGQKLNIRI